MEVVQKYIGLKAREKNITKRKLNIKGLFTHLSLIFFSIIMIFPFIWMIVSALKTKEEMWQFPPSLIPQVPQWQNFIEAFGSAPFGLYMFNSTFTAIAIVAIQVVNSAMIAYALTQLEFKGKKYLFGIILGTYMLPGAATFVPSYIILSKLNLLNSYTGLIISNAVNIFGIFLIRQAFLQVNKSLVEAAKIDGANHWQILWKILFPLTKPSFITFGLISFVTNYNNYLWPSLIIKNPELNLISMGLRQFFIQEGAYGTEWPVVMAASTFTVLPLLILFLVAQKWFMNGFSDTGVKG
ncbi:carbohydrate ABC transporter permease [Tepidibacter aestuarii]|uniref:carbohydrate ABC transporter permease n=1 Tax=Tepidibacter aestuarii TaxID=2925782 RepID=UPI0020BDCA68|nr:carbohydrate ABC transporter permease [Tepidibacter aestuarii]CAH2212157.1 Carbohydrate ABC transporter permease [Tepidibacter aestuarii]